MQNFVLFPQELVAVVDAGSPSLGTNESRDQGDCNDVSDIDIDQVPTKLAAIKNCKSVKVRSTGDCLIANFSSVCELRKKKICLLCVQQLVQLHHTTQVSFQDLRIKCARLF